MADRKRAAALVKLDAVATASADKAYEIIGAEHPSVAVFVATKAGLAYDIRNFSPQLLRAIALKFEEKARQIEAVQTVSRETH